VTNESTPAFSASCLVWSSEFADIPDDDDDDDDNDGDNTDDDDDDNDDDNYDDDNDDVNDDDNYDMMIMITPAFSASCLV
jgi:ABC-type Zn2+ transport system substrate-binding protein/surface adhesin